MSGLRQAVPLVALVGLIVAAAVVTGQRPPGDGPPLDPASTGPLGTAALVETLELLGARVQLTSSPPARTDGTALLLVDTQDERQHEALRGWVSAGGTLVVADPRSPMSAGPAADPGVFLPATRLEPGCDLAALAHVRSVEAPGAVALESPPGARVCFPRGEGHWLVVVGEGDGAIVSLGGPEVWTNRRIGAADNVHLAMALLAPHDRSRVAVLQPPRPGEGDATLADVLHPGVPAAVLQAVLGFLLFAVWRARRLGRPPGEPPQVQIPAAELVVAAGNLYHQAHARERAADVIREDLRAALRRRLGLPPGADDRALAETAGQATGIDAAKLAAVLGGPAPADDRSLTRVARDVERLRRALEDPHRQGGDRAT